MRADGKSRISSSVFHLEKSKPATIFGPQEVKLPLQAQRYLIVYMNCAYSDPQPSLYILKVKND